MSINIIGGNGSKLVLITENKIDNKFKDFEDIYNLLKRKYLSKCNSNIIDKQCYKHLLKRLSILFIGYNNINDLVIYTNKRNKLDTLYKHVKIIFKNFDLLHHLHYSIKLINKKINYSNNDNKFMYNINHILNILQDYNIDESRRNEMDTTISNIKDILNNINDEILILKNTPIENKHMILIDVDESKTFSNKFISNLVISLDDIIEINKIINSNIYKLIELINQFTDNLTNIYSLI